MAAHPSNNPRGIEEVRLALLRFLARQRELALAYDLPNLPTIVEIIRERLTDETCTIAASAKPIRGRALRQRDRRPPEAAPEGDRPSHQPGVPRAPRRT
ncbi:MAG: hypothetical protein U0841_29365 [Chloroflexia bacterium]